MGEIRYCRRARKLSLGVFEKDTRYSSTCIFFLSVSSIDESLAKDAQTPTAKVILLDAPGRASGACSGNVSEDRGHCQDVFDKNFDQLTVFRQCSLRLSWSRVGKFEFGSPIEPTRSPSLVTGTPRASDCCQVTLRLACSAFFHRLSPWLARPR